MFYNLFSNFWRIMFYARFCNVVYITVVRTNVWKPDKQWLKLLSFSLRYVIFFQIDFTICLLKIFDFKKLCSDNKRINNIFTSTDFNPNRRNVEFVSIKQKFRRTRSILRTGAPERYFTRDKKATEKMYENVKNSTKIYIRAAAKRRRIQSAAIFHAPLR